jgi:hypothetical protein
MYGGQVFIHREREREMRIKDRALIGGDRHWLEKSKANKRNIHCLIAAVGGEGDENRCGQDSPPPPKATV